MHGRAHGQATKSNITCQSLWASFLPDIIVLETRWAGDKVISSKGGLLAHVADEGPQQEQ